MRHFKVILAYDGGGFFGWQWQNERRTVQGVFEQALQSVTQEQIRVAASGRTDTGVHALGQVVSFASETRLSAETLLKALNANLPADVQTLDVTEEAEGFHAITNAIGKRYRYVIQDGRRKDVFLRHYAWWVPRRLDLDAMRTASKSLIGTQDFRSFETAGSPRVSTVRTVTDLTIERRQGFRETVEIEVEADGFLYNMVRNIVGTLTLVGRGDRPPEWVAGVLAAKDRRLAGMKAPAHGLFLVQVQFRPSCESPTLLPA